MRSHKNRKLLHCFSVSTAHNSHTHMLRNRNEPMDTHTQCICAVVTFIIHFRFSTKNGNKIFVDDHIEHRPNYYWRQRARLWFCGFRICVQEDCVCSHSFIHYYYAILHQSQPSCTRTKNCIFFCEKPKLKMHKNESQSIGQFRWELIFASRYYTLQK